MGTVQRPIVRASQ